MHALKLDKISKTYGTTQVVKGISLEIQPGEIFGLLGPNGAGKSTTINMITGVTSIGGGHASVFGHDCTKDYIQSRCLTGVMNQEIVVDTFFTIEQGLKIHSGYYGIPDDPEWRNLLLDRLALRPHLKKQMNKLSGGMKRRYMVAKALIHKPKLLILDEPTAGVDVELRKNLWEFVREMNQKEGTTVLLTTHYLEEAEEMCGRVAIMNHGEIIALDNTRSLLDKLDEKRLLIHLQSNLSAVPESLKKFSVELTNNGNTLNFHMTKNLTPVEIVQAVAGLGLAVRELETRAPNLQEAFLKLTKGSHNRE